MEWGRRGEENYHPVPTYKELYKACQQDIAITDEGEFHAMVSYFHALGLLIHICGADVTQVGHGDCLVFTNPSYLFENISKLYQVQFEAVEGEDMILLKDEGKLTRAALKDLDIDEVHLEHDDFMDLLVKLFIGAELTKPHEGSRTLFVPSVLSRSPRTGPQLQQPLCFAITFKRTSFIPCGVFTGMIARLLSSEGWDTCPTSTYRLRMEFGVGSLGTVILFDHATHISVQMDRSKELTVEQYQEWRDTILAKVADSYCFLFHCTAMGKPQSESCSECVESPYLVLGQTCQMCSNQSSGTPEDQHFAELKVEEHQPKSVRCKVTNKPEPLSDDDLQLGLFQNISHYVS